MAFSVHQSLQDAILEFKGALTPDQSDQLQAITAVPDEAAVITLTAQLDEENAQRRTSCVASRLCTLLQSVQQFTTIVDTFVSSHPNIAALVWGSVKLTMLIACNFASYFDKLSAMFMGFNKLCPRFAEYQDLYPNSTRLQASLCDFHASIILYCKQIILVIRRPWPSQVVNALWRSFEAEFAPYEAEVKRCSKVVEKEISLAKAQADHQDHQLQLQEREATRQSWRSFITKTGSETEESREWRMRKDERAAIRRRQRLLDSLTTYNHMGAFKQARRRRHGTTAEWLAQSAEYKRWIEDITFSAFLCSGKLGSGKTVLTANVTNNLFLNRIDKDERITFFFCRFDEAVSLKAETILASIIRQFLSDTSLPTHIESSLEEYTQNALSDIEELGSLLQKIVVLFQTCYIVIDALDECDKSERDLVLTVLQSATASTMSKVKVFLASRDSMVGEIKGRYPSLQHVSMGSRQGLSDIMTYTREVIDGRLNIGDLVVGSHQLVKEIQDALIQGSQGMSANFSPNASQRANCARFLWVAFQIDEICSQHSDEDIRQALRELPKDLAETFDRALFRILTKGNAKTAKQVFRLVAAAKRPLSLEELREVIATEPGQTYFKSERMLNGMSRITAWCENLITLDEEDEVIQFTHNTVRRYLLANNLNEQLNELHFPLQDADHELGEICVTYLSLDIFRMPLIQQLKPQPAITPSVICETALGHRTISSVAKPLFLPVVSEHRQKATKIDVRQQLARYGGIDHENSAKKRGHPFLDYASKYWLLHTTTFKHDKSTTWSLWTGMLVDKQSLGQKPWTHEQFIKRDLKVGRWICDEHHGPLLGLVKFPDEGREYLMQYIITKGDVVMLEIFLASGGRRVRESSAALLRAAAEGHLEIVDRLLEANTNVNSSFDVHGQTALQLATRTGHLEIVERLLAAKANVHASAGGAFTALQIAARTGHLEIVERLLAAKANVHASAGGAFTALQIAAGKGHLEIVDRLLTAKANVDSGAGTRDNQTALQLAAQGGHLEIVDRLLTAKADVNAYGGFLGQTALQLAAGKGHLEIVDRLLTAKANIDSGAGTRDNQTALQLAAQGGHLEIVDRLLTAKADVNAYGGFLGQTALQLAAEEGHLEIVDRLLVAKAEVDAVDVDGVTALQLAAKRGHLEIVHRLIKANADVNHVNKDGETASQLAAKKGHRQIKARLRTAEAS